MSKAGERLIAAAKEAKRLSDEGFARRVDIELDARGYPTSHPLRIEARVRYGAPSILEPDNTKRKGDYPTPQQAAPRPPF